MSNPITNTYLEYSEFELEKLYAKVKGEESYEETGAVGSVEENLEVKSVVKKYKGIEAKNRTRGTGTGSLKFTMHMNYGKYKKFFGMEHDDLVEGVAAYGQPSVHKPISITEKVLDEDGIVKYKAYPNCMVKTGPSNKITNASEEVAEIEVEVAIQPDEYGYGMYEALAEELTPEMAKKWLTEFTPEMVRKTTASGEQTQENTPTV